MGYTVGNAHSLSLTWELTLKEMANPEHHAKLREGVRAWNEWRERESVLLPDLSRLNGRNENLAGANLNGVNLTESDFVGASFSGANLVHANLSRINVSQADFRGANLN